MKSQEQAIKKHLESGQSITPLEALKKFGSFRLGARIHRLKNQGMEIKTRIVSQDGKRFAEYYL